MLALEGGWFQMLEDAAEKKESLACRLPWTFALGFVVVLVSLGWLLEDGG